MRYLRPVYTFCLPALLASSAGCSADSDSDDTNHDLSGGGPTAPTGGATGTTGGVSDNTGGWASLTGGTPTGGVPGPTGGSLASTGGLPTGGFVSATGGWLGATGGFLGTTGGMVSTGGTDPTGGAPTGGAPTGGTDPTGGAPGTGGTTSIPEEPFSFFVTSLEGMLRLSNSPDGFGGDLRYGEADGLTGADKICTELAEASMPGAGAKQWRAFLSVAQGPDGNPVHAINRIGDGPWYDRLGRIVAMDRSSLLTTRPTGADPAIANDLPNEYGVPNHDPDGTGEVDNHHVLTGSNENGELYGDTSTCNGWTTADSSAGRPRIGFSWPAGNRQNWISGQDEGGCGAGVNTAETGGSNPNNPIVGSGGGYGGIYCFALTP